MLEGSFLKRCPKCGAVPSVIGSMTLHGTLMVQCPSCGAMLAEEEEFDTLVEIANQRHCDRCESIAGAASTALHGIREAIRSGLPDRSFELTPQQKRSIIDMIDSFDPRIDGNWPC